MCTVYQGPTCLPPPYYHACQARQLLHIFILLALHIHFSTSRLSCYAFGKTTMLVHDTEVCLKNGGTNNAFLSRMNHSPTPSIITLRPGHDSLSHMTFVMHAINNYY